MKHTTGFSGSRRRVRGVVLPIVLVVMMVVTMLVVTQVRRGTVDERMAGNWTRAIEGQARAESLLRYCEASMFAANNEQAKNRRNLVLTENYNQGTPAWKSNLPANGAIPFAADVLPAGATATCVVEDASSDLLPSFYQQRSGTAGVPLAELLKYRFTVSLTMPDANLFGSTVYTVQSEVRFGI